MNAFYVVCDVLDNDHYDLPSAIMEGAAFTEMRDAEVRARADAVRGPVVIAKVSVIALYRRIHDSNTKHMNDVDPNCVV